MIEVQREMNIPCKEENERKVWGTGRCSVVGTFCPSIDMALDLFFKVRACGMSGVDIAGRWALQTTVLVQTLVGNTIIHINTCATYLDKIIKSLIIINNQPLGRPSGRPLIPYSLIY